MRLIVLTGMPVCLYNDSTVSEFNFNVIKTTASSNVTLLGTPDAGSSDLEYSNGSPSRLHMLPKALR
jgi:hypothetical protein